MRWTRDPRRSARLGRRPALEHLECRTVLSAAGLAPLPMSIVPQPEPTQTPGSSGTSSQSYEPIINAAAVRLNYGVDGSGLTAAVIDTGVGYKHDALGGGFGSGYKVVAGYDFGDSDADPDATTWNHGTAVAGVIASDDPSYPGVAPGADIVALKVFDSENKGSYEKIADALRWVVDNHQTHRISVVNLSIADGGNYTHDFFGRDGGIGQKIAGLIDELKALNIPVVSAAGNSFKGQEGMGFTAILSETISVTATDSSDSLLDNAQRLGVAKGKERATDLAAPGAGITAPSGVKGFSNVRGTSFSTPLVSGSILLLQSIHLERFGELPTVAQLESWLEQGSVPIVDASTGITLSRLDVARAAGYVPEAPALPPPQETPPASGPVTNPTQPPVDTDPPAGDGGSEDPSPPGSGDPDPPVQEEPSEEEPPSTPPVEEEPTSPPVDPPASPPSSPSEPPASPPAEPDPETPPAEEVPADPPVSDPPPPVESPAPSPPVEPDGPTTDVVLADLYRNGRHLGMVEVGSDEDPSRGALDAFGLQGVVRTIHLWSATQQGADPDPGPAQAAGEVLAAPVDRWSSRRAAWQERLGIVPSRLGAIARRAGSFVQRLRGW